MLAALTVSTLSSCTGMYDNLKEFATEETVYPAGFDIITGKIGFERVEIDLCSEGRIPASQMKLSKAVRTVIECSGFDEPLIIDSVCSWVNITGLTQPEEYTFTVYTEDEYGDRSTPKEISLVPYTSYDLEQVELLPPKITEARSTALFEWQGKLSGVLFDCYGYAYEYTDRDGNVRTGAGEGDIPSFFIENITKGNTVPVKVTCRIVPKKNEVPIIDTVNWQSVISLTVSESAEEVIFLKTPANIHSIDMNSTEGSPSCIFSWTEAEGITSYTLKISTRSDFQADRTVEFNAGNKSSLELDVSEFADVSGGSARYYWTVVPSSATGRVNTQTRTLSVFRRLFPSGLWLFDDPSSLFKASTGEDLIEESSGGNRITAAEGPSAGNSAIFVPEFSYLTCRHGVIPEPGETYVNKFTVLMNIKLSSFRWFSIADINTSNGNGEWFVSPEGELSINGYWGSASENMKPDTWHRVIYSVNLNESVRIYLDGKLIKTISTGAGWKDGDYALRPELYLFRDDDSWNDRNDAYVSEIIVWGLTLNNMEVEYLENIPFRQN
jgi:hypothetical protein